ncbi:MAG TPA: hypothetical protein VIH88_07940 [Candidatus Acidoferrales bacterium]
MLEFIQSRRFTIRLDNLAGQYADQVLSEIENDLLKNPAAGAIVPGTGGLRKARAADPTRNKGKRGGFRYMYFYLEQDGRIFLLLIYNKDEQDDLTTDQKKWLRDNWERL